MVTRADARHPRRLKARLNEDARLLLYGCGDIALLRSRMPPWVTAVFQKGGACAAAIEQPGRLCWSEQIR